MAWKRLGQVTNEVVSRLVGEDGAATLSVSRKEPEAVTPPAKLTGLRQEGVPVAVLRAQERDTTLPGGRWEYTASKAGAPHSSAVYCHLRLVVDNGGRQAPEGGRVPAGRSRASVEGLGAEAREWLKLVH